MKKMIYVSILLLSTVSLMSCETIKGTTVGASTGFGKDIKNTTEAFVGRVDENGVRHPGSVQKADSWIQKNLW